MKSPKQVNFSGPLFARGQFSSVSQACYTHKHGSAPQVDLVLCNHRDKDSRVTRQAIHAGLLFMPSVSSNRRASLPQKDGSTVWEMQPIKPPALILMRASAL